jgi:hypothetical protein
MPSKIITADTDTGGPGWEPIKYDPVTGILTEIKVEPCGPGHQKIMTRSTYVLRDEHLAMNAERRAENAGRSWGDGAVAASIPLPLYYAKFAEARKQGDTNHIKRLLNDPDYKYLRTKDGTI